MEQLTNGGQGPGGEWEAILDVCALAHDVGSAG